MTVVERANGKIEDSEVDGNTILTITLQGIVPTDPDMLDRILQGAMIETSLDTSWKEAEPPPLNPGPQEATPVT